MSNHSFDVHIATEYKSVEIAILVWHFQYWIMRNKRLGKNLHENRTWTYQTIQEIAAVFPYWSIKQVERLLKRAIELGILVKNNFNKSQFDRTMWYAFQDEEKFSISRIREMENPESGNGNLEIGRPIPDTLPDTLPNKEREGHAPPTRSSISSQEKNVSCDPKKTQRAKHVTTTSAEHKKLVEEYGEDMVRKAYIRLSEWKEDTPKSKWKKCDYRSILRWVMEAVRESASKKKTGFTNIEKNKKLAQGVYDKFRNRQDIILGNTYIEFLNGMTSEHIGFEDNAFKERLINQLRKRRIDVGEWLKD